MVHSVIALGTSAEYLQAISSMTSAWESAGQSGKLLNPGAL